MGMENYNMRRVGLSHPVTLCCPDGIRIADGLYRNYARRMILNSVLCRVNLIERRLADLTLLSQRAD